MLVLRCIQYPVFGAVLRSFILFGTGVCDMEALTFSSSRTRGLNTFGLDVCFKPGFVFFSSSFYAFDIGVSFVEHSHLDTFRLGACDKQALRNVSALCVLDSDVRNSLCSTASWFCSCVCFPVHAALVDTSYTYMYALELLGRWDIWHVQNKFYFYLFLPSCLLLACAACGVWAVDRGISVAISSTFDECTNSAIVLSPWPVFGEVYP